MGRYLDPKNDFIFKRIFEENPHLLKSFLNTVLPLEAGQAIEELCYLPSENLPEVSAFKYSVVDVKCTDNFGRAFIVEMQRVMTGFFSGRILHYAAHTYSRQAIRGGNYDVPSVYALGILNYIYDRETPEYYHRYQIANCMNVREKIKGIEIIMIELPKFRPETVTEKRMAALWLRFLKETNEDTYRVAEELLESKDISEALHICEEGLYTPEDRATYDAYRDRILSQNSYEKELESELNKGLALGKAEGLAEGKAEGLAEGKAEGLAEGEAKAAGKIARNLLSLGLSIENIAKSTGLTPEEIKKIEN